MSTRDPLRLSFAANANRPDAPSERPAGKEEAPNDYRSVNTNAVGGAPPAALSAMITVWPVPAPSVAGTVGVTFTITLAARLAAAVPAGTARTWYDPSGAMFTYTDAAEGATLVATGVAVARSALGAVTKTSTAPAAGLTFTTRTEVWPVGIAVVLSSVVENDVTVAPPVPPTA